MTSRFLQIHTLTPYHASLLNRDDAGFAKRIPFGGATRTRISSQCLKRHWRQHDGGLSLGAIDGVELSVRSRVSFERFVVQPLVHDHGVSEAIARAVAAKLQAMVLGQKDATPSDDSADAATDNDSKQVTVLGHPELRYILELAVEVAGDPTVREAAGLAGKGAAKKLADAIGARVNEGELKKNLAALGRAAQGLDGAVFGRMVTSDILSRTDAAVHVAHAFTVHHEDAESDYFSAMDDLVAETGALGSGHINASELNTGLYYGYVAIDVPLLISNLEGVKQSDWQAADRILAAEVVRRLVHTIAEVSPGAKKGSTAPYSRAHLVLVEAGDAQPRSLANAFLQPVRKDATLEASTFRALSRHLGEMDDAYETGEARRAMAIGARDALEWGDDVLVRRLADVAAWAADRVRG